MYLIRDRAARSPVLFDQILCDAGIQTVLTGVRTPRMNAIIERWVQTCRHELLDRTLIWNEHHLRHALRQFELHHNAHRPHQARNQAAPLRTVPEPITDPEQITRLDIRRQDQLGGVIHEYRNAA
ncbi:integrase core domain-containing protein [Streptomyces sp. NBC_01445]|uniref:integrase core domain-containing protein n=1 Tax=Streptomyces sp. NBC_01445 TaxID=2903869 RepID=UPI002DD999DD|nr:integrase core domain-containing protein [Streptomyces sp. NBC_01445]WSE03736.1 integrase core domain-containing protein [Streptomyces sp. NBC_01445]